MRKYSLGGKKTRYFNSNLNMTKKYWFHCQQLFVSAKLVFLGLVFLNMVHSSAPVEFQFQKVDDFSEILVELHPSIIWNLSPIPKFGFYTCTEIILYFLEILAIAKFVTSLTVL